MNFTTELDKHVLHLKGITWEDCLSFANFLGDLIPMEEDLSTGNKTGDLWTDVQYDPTVANSYRHSNTRQPFHTDGSYESNAPDICFLYCIESPDYGGETIFLPVATLIDILKATDEDLLQDLNRIVVKHFKGNDERIRPILVNNTISWNFFRAEQTPEAQELLLKFKKFLDHLEQCHIAKSISLAPNEAIFFRDSSVLHGRNAFLGNRWLKKGGIKCQIAP